VIERGPGDGARFRWKSGEQPGIGAEVVLDFMFWPWPGRKFGWFLEPSYSYSFSSGHEQSLGVSVGLPVPIP
jgi:hypothetical protein